MYLPPFFSRRRTALSGVLAVTLLVPLAVQAQRTQLVSSFNGEQAQGRLTDPIIVTGLSCISNDGQVIGFYSQASNLSNNDGNGLGDLFVRGIRGAKRVSVGPGGAASDAEIDLGLDSLVNTSAACHLDADGSHIAFASKATTLIEGDAGDNITDVFVRNLITDTTIKVTAGANADSISPALSGTGNFVVFLSRATNLDSRCNNGKRHVFRASIGNPNDIEIRCISVNASGVQANGDSRLRPDISNGGQYSVFDSDASNLVSGDTNGVGDIFLYNSSSNTSVPIRRLSVSTTGAQANGPSDRAVISADSRVIAFVSAASNLVPGDTNAGPGQAPGEAIDVFVYDRSRGGLQPERANLGDSGQQANAVNDAGISPGIDPDISDDGRFVTFVSSSTNLVAGDDNGQRDIFLRDREEETTSLVSLTFCDDIADRRSFRPAISGNGRFVAFDSIATNLIPSDTNNGFDVLLRDTFSPWILVDSFEDEPEPPPPLDDDDCPA